MTPTSDEHAGIHERPVQLLQDLIRFDTTNPPGNEVECIKYIDALLIRSGIQTNLIFKDPNRPNVIARLKGEGVAPPLMLYGHVDVVTAAGREWTYPPFEGRIADGFLWGRGALDMKGGVAMMLTALLRAKAEGFRPAGDIILAVVSDEEAGGHFGARYLVENHAHLFAGTRYALGEFGGFSMVVGGETFYPIQIGEKQICWMRAVLRGPSGHGSLPMRGGAMGRLGRLLAALDELRLPVRVTPVPRLMIEAMASGLPFLQGLILRRLLNPIFTDRLLKRLGHGGEFFEPMLRNTVNATVVRGGEKVNVIPSEVTVELDGRLVPGCVPEDLIAELKPILGDDVGIEVIAYDPGPGEPDMGLFDTLADAVRAAEPASRPLPFMLTGCTDARFFSRLGIQTYGFMPMKLPGDFPFTRYIHAVDERIPVESVMFGSNVMFDVLKRYKG
jgi:acetylornithine deacetylase/succinyl-diaminopimelate desuccinylase-like protein